MGRRDPYLVFLGAKAVGIGWIGSVLGPIFVMIGLVHDQATHLIIGAVLIWLAISTIRDGLRGRDNGVTSDYIFMSIVPGALLSLSTAFWLLVFFVGGAK